HQVRRTRSRNHISCTLPGRPNIHIFRPKFRAMKDRTMWRKAGIEDAEGIAALSRQLLPDHPEEAAVFAERIALCPEGCHVLPGADGIAGYVISHPWRRRMIPPLNAPLGTLPEQADCWYI